MASNEKGIKVAVSGKGGVGKTTLSALLCWLYARERKKVLAVDADPDANLGSALGFSPEELKSLVPIAQHRQLIKERTGAEPGISGQMFSLNPRVDDIPDRYVLEKEGIKLLQMGTVTRGGGGCACPEGTLLKHLLRHLVVKREEAVVVDMEAGLEHLGRGTAESVDAFIVVVEPGQRSIQTARDVVRLARDLGVERVYAVVNKVREGQEEVLREQLDFLPLLGVLPFDLEAVSADLEGRAVFEASPRLVAAAEGIKEELERLLAR
ncbi:carbon monoxide dehydrogenase [Clostridiales bacterium PH28_bin88]|nr:carbon monoxide dehydrogenase [Clostridiales bacterium PH28_bin88]